MVITNKEHYKHTPSHRPSVGLPLPRWWLKGRPLVFLPVFILSGSLLRPSFLEQLDNFGVATVGSHGQTTSWETLAPRSIRIFRSAQSPVSSGLPFKKMESPAPSPGLALRGVRSLMELSLRSRNVRFESDSIKDIQVIMGTSVIPKPDGGYNVTLLTRDKSTSRVNQSLNELESKIRSEN